MKCQFCNAVMKPKVTPSGIKYCPKCELIVGSKGVKIFDKPLPPPLPPKPEHLCKEHAYSLTGQPKEVKGKYQPHLVLGSLTRAIARVREYGVLKYHGEDGWKQQTTKDYMDAIGRHYDACRNDTAARDSESGLLHIAQIATNAMFIIQMLSDADVDLDIMNQPEERKSDGN